MAPAPGFNVVKQPTSTLNLIKEVGEDPKERRTKRHIVKSYLCGHKLMSFVWAMVVLAAYGGLALLWMGYEQWDVTTAFYFAAMTCSTVGYGDISPSAEPGGLFGSRAFTVFMIFVGIAIVFPAVGAALSQIFLEPITKCGRALLERCFPMRMLDLEGDGEADFPVPRHPIIYYPKQLLPSLLLNLAAQLISAAVFVSIEGWDYGSAIYHCLVTATTVGYGDQSIGTSWGRRFASIHMLMSVVFLAELLSAIDNARIKRREQLARVKALTRELDRKFVGRLMQRAVNMRPSVMRDGKGVTELEFVLGMLMELEAVDVALVTPFIKQFRTLDISGDGRLGLEDLTQKETLSKDEVKKLVRERSMKAAKNGAALVDGPKNASARVAPAVPAEAA